MTTPPYEVAANDTTLLTFDGRVLELFGFVDTLRAFAALPARGVAGRPRL